MAEEQRTLRIVVQAAKGLKDTVSFFGKQSPYVHIKIGDKEGWSSIAYSGGTSPKFDKKKAITFKLSSELSGDSNKVEANIFVRSKNQLVDAEIGDVDISLQDLLETPERWWPLNAPGKGAEGPNHNQESPYGYVLLNVEWTAGAREMKIARYRQSPSSQGDEEAGQKVVVNFTNAELSNPEEPFQSMEQGGAQTFTSFTLTEMP
mmetsp:Transcript_9590/g.17512  ORF Transcript_9590/g.17512 Transcript_9590/m.17512 type:complete len:205 (-) Transcript_9590:48-662(-)|eukprot:CAMPEP_0197525990 /NCGR_PEP_ID=MMETSP1318-20131121/15541_1 /TAXON_ID=552666 /ORGANISM="Partenskyella glossopodia, Strain RCC365" /LENGTH=204 /DNA_ID=CAMNT_0043079887 /DNA_START=58 /DNA_END=672 /DNA_ORIENTATION=-